MLNYQRLNRGIATRLGRLHSAECVLYSVDFAEIEAVQSSGRWTDAARRLAQDAKSLEAAGVGLGLLGTAFTVGQTFYRERLEQHGLTVLVPGEQDRRLVHAVVYDELCHGIVRSKSRAAYRDVIGQQDSPCRCSRPPRPMSTLPAGR